MTFLIPPKPPILMLYHILDVPLSLCLNDKDVVFPSPLECIVPLNTNTPIPSCYSFFNSEQMLLYYAACYSPKDPFAFFYYFMDGDIYNGMMQDPWDLIAQRFGVQTHMTTLRDWMTYNHLSLFMYYNTAKYRGWVASHGLTPDSPQESLYKALAAEQMRMAYVINTIVRDTFTPAWIRRNEATRYDPEDDDAHRLANMVYSATELSDSNTSLMSESDTTLINEDGSAHSVISLSPSPPSDMDEGSNMTPFTLSELSSALEAMDEWPLIRDVRYDDSYSDPGILLNDYSIPYDYTFYSFERDVVWDVIESLNR